MTEIVGFRSITCYSSVGDRHQKKRFKYSWAQWGSRGGPSRRRFGNCLQCVCDHAGRVSTDTRVQPPLDPLGLTAHSLRRSGGNPADHHGGSVNKRAEADGFRQPVSNENRHAEFGRGQSLGHLRDATCVSSPLVSFRSVIKREYRSLRRLSLLGDFVFGTNPFLVPCTPREMCIRPFLRHVIPVFLPRMGD